MALAYAPALENRPSSGLFPKVTEAAPRAEGATLVVEGKGARIGGRAIDAGTYRVRVDEARERIVLESEARTYALTAFFRRPQVVSIAPIEASLEAGMNGRSFVVVRTSRGAEWVA
jgi:hypothetical protein